MPVLDNTAAVREAFSRQSPVFDAIDEGNAIISRMRGIARSAALSRMRQGESILELNAGTGIDSFWFAQHGMTVLATDDAPGMVERMCMKLATAPDAPVEPMLCSFLELEQLGQRRFHHVFSDFGGINCTSRLDEVLSGIDRVLLPGGTCTLVIMPRVSPWELLAALKGRFGFAFRRFRKGGTAARLEGVTFTCHYHSANRVKRLLGPRYEVLTQRALSLCVPPPHHERFPNRRPAVFRFLCRAEDAIAHRWPFRSWGDHYLIVLRKRP